MCKHYNFSELYDFSYTVFITTTHILSYSETPPGRYKSIPFLSQSRCINLLYHTNSVCYNEYE